MRIASLAAGLFLFWLALSGHYTPLLVGLGLASTALCVWVVRRLDMIDSESQPTQVYFNILTYYPWLFWEIVKSAWSVTKIVLHPSLPISPTMTVVEGSQRTTVGIATYGNSITLTPGTITTEISGNVLTVHALVREGALDLEEGGMDRHVTRFEGGS